MPPAPSALVASYLASGGLPFSRSIAQVQGLLASAEYDARDLAAFLRLDPTLAARVMAVANSAYFSRNPCADIDAAVSRLGAVQLGRIFSHILARGALIQPLRAYGLPANALWRRSVFTAIGAEMAAARKGHDRAAAYTVGLLHLLGLLVVDRLWQEARWTEPLALDDFEEEWSEDERNLCGWTHADLGEELLRQLSFPPGVFVAVGRLYEPPSVPLEHALYLGRLVQSCAFETPTLSPDCVSLREFDLIAPPQLEAFLAEVRAEALNIMQAA
jgi:HD-like signal output (HDOD) protein